ncbi:hypothetical protein ACHHYP_00253 [Achlya hypogyna]|uniref:START domain-containing protein n=1 Tax=Achlya hypogyna TaxID=1202772 RepID=A0A1V9ZB85_ACHHY|nr:hypothetical protein ACHHYP_00253 [Achlya hypogyna]
MQTSAQVLTYPLSNTFFGCLPLLPQRLASFQQEGEMMIQEFARAVLTPDDRTMLWRDIGTHDGAQLYEGDILGLNLHKACITPFRGVTKICGTTIEEVAALHAFKTREDCIQHVELHQRDVLLDLMTLYCLHDRSPEAPFKRMYIQWAACASPLPQLIRARDFVYLEAQDEIILPSGRRAWVSCQQSIELDSVPSLADTTLQLVRGELHRSGLIIMETDRIGELDVVYNFAADLKGRMACWARKMLFKRRMCAVTSLYDSIQKLRFAHQPLKTQEECQWEVPKAASYYKSCALCYAVSRFRRLECCQSCTQAVCGKCSRVWTLHKAAVRGEGKARICSACATAHRSYALNRHYTVCGSPYDSTATSSGGWTKGTPTSHSFAGGWSSQTPSGTPLASSFVGERVPSEHPGKHPDSGSFIRRPSKTPTMASFVTPWPKRPASDSFLKKQGSGPLVGGWTKVDAVLVKSESSIFERPSARSGSVTSRQTPRGGLDVSYVHTVLERSESRNCTLLGEAELRQLMDDAERIVFADPPKIQSS